MREGYGGYGPLSTNCQAMPAVRLLAAQFAIGAAAIFARFALAGAGPLAVAALRLGIAAAVCLAIVGPFARLGRRREFAFAAAGLALAVHFASWFGSLLYTSVAVSTLLVTTTPLWTELYDIARERRPPARSFLSALAMALTGVALIALARPASPAPVVGHALAGDALALAGSVAIGAYLLIVRDAGENGDGSRLGTRQIVARTYTWSALALAAGSLATHQFPPPIANYAAWSGIIVMALVSQLLGHTALNAALHDFSPSTVAMTTLLEPLVAAVFAAWIFRETLSWQAALGGVLVLGAIAVTLRASGRASAAAAAPS